MSVASLLMCDSVMDESSWEHAAHSFDVLIDAMPLGVLVALSRPMQSLWLSTTGMNIWSEECNGSSGADEHWRMGLKVCMRVQVLHNADRVMSKAQTMYGTLHSKAIDLSSNLTDFLGEYPGEASTACAERMFCLISDMIMNTSLECKPHLHTSDGHTNSHCLSTWNPHQVALSKSRHACC